VGQSCSRPWQQSRKASERRDSVCVGRMAEFVTVGWGGWFTLGVLVIMMVVLAKEWMTSEQGMVLALSVITAAQIITLPESLAGFSNAGVLTVAILYVVAAGLSGTGALDYFVNKALGRPRSLAAAQLRLMIPTAILSAFLNNTPLVAILIPVVHKWAPIIKQPVSQLMILVSYAAILGGTLTMLGTSTNM
jgi:Na+/H+ antiporter NhaD/arsenite permease-like protein